MPITVPLEKAVRKPGLSPFLQAITVLPFEAVAIFMPIYPARPEKIPPVRKAKGV